MEGAEAVEQLGTLRPSGERVRRRWRRVAVVRLGRARSRHDDRDCEQRRENDLAHAAPPFGRFYANPSNAPIAQALRSV